MIGSVAAAKTGDHLKSLTMTEQFVGQYRCRMRCGPRRDSSLFNREGLPMRYVANLEHLGTKP